MASLVLVIHERIGTWARQLRPRLVGVADPAGRDPVGGRPRGGAGRRGLPGRGDRPGPPARAPGSKTSTARCAVAPDALVLVLDPEAHDGVAPLARELGATHVVAGPATPPAVAALLARWLPLARRRAEADGWSVAREPEPEPEPWNWLRPLLSGTPEAPDRTAGPDRVPRPHRVPDLPSLT